MIPTSKQKKKRFVIYTRCSTDDQAQGDFTTLDAQAHHCKNMLDAFEYELADIGNDGIVNDDGYSGKDLNRPGIQMILQDIHKAKSFDGIIFFRLDRLTRNPRDLYSMIDLFRASDIDFVSVRENLDSSTAIGRVVIGILGLLSAFERELTGERVKASAIARVRQGFRIGGKTPIGYKLIKDGDPLPNGKQSYKAVIDEKTAPVLRKVWEMAAENKSLTAIGHELLKYEIQTATGKIWRRSGLSHIIKNPFYKGYIQYSGEIHKAKHEPLIDESLWEKANAVLKARLPGHKFVKVKRKYDFLFESRMKCGHCGSALVCVHSIGHMKDKFYYYECARARQGLGCTFKRLSATTFDQAMIDYLKRASNDQEIIKKAIGNAIQESQVKLESILVKLKEKESALSDFKNQAEQLIQLALNNAIPQGSTYKIKMIELETKIALAEDEIEKLDAQKKVAQINVSSAEFLHYNIKFAMQNIDKAPIEARKNFLCTLIKDITVYDDKIAINMYIEPVTDYPLPPQKDKNPVRMHDPNEVLASTAGSSTDCTIWGG